MITKESLCEVEAAYIKTFADVVKTPYGFRFIDNQLKNMYCHNFLRLSFEHVTEVQTVLEEERAFRKANGNPVVQLEIFDCPRALLETFLPPDKLQEQTLMYVEIDTLIQAGSGKPYRKKDPDYKTDPELHFASCEADFEKGILLDMESFGLGFAEFAKQRYKRKQSDYADPKIPMLNMICYTEENLIGRCDFFYTGKYGKVEDFDVVERFQRRGYGTEILHEIAVYGKKQGVEIFQLQVDSDNSAQEMYRKLGFIPVCNNLIYLEELS